MQLIITRPKQPFKWLKAEADLLKYWFYQHDIFIGDERTHFELSWNDFHGFYDLILIEFKENGPQARTHHFQKVIDFLKAESYRIEVDKCWWRWDHSTKPPTQLKAVRIWIYPRDDNGKETT